MRMGQQNLAAWPVRAGAHAASFTSNYRVTGASV